MPLGQQEIERIGAFLKERIPKPNQCQLCGHNQWALGSHILELREFAGGNLAAGGVTYPFIPLICTFCGNTLLVNAIIAGVVPPPSSKEEKHDAK